MAEETGFTPADEAGLAEFRKLIELDGDEAKMAAMPDMYRNIEALIEEVNFALSRKTKTQLFNAISLLSDPGVKCVAVMVEGALAGSAFEETFRNVRVRNPNAELPNLDAIKKAPVIVEIGVAALAEGVGRKIIEMER
jgi:hypothetical protein